jgi:hypothetical protein
MMVNNVPGNKELPKPAPRPPLSRIKIFPHDPPCFIKKGTIWLEKVYATK